MVEEKDYNLGLYEKAMPHELSLEEKLGEAKKAGYDFLELSIDETEAKLARLKWTREERNDILRAMADAGLPVLTMCLSGHRKYPMGSEDPAIRERGLEIMKDAILLARDLGIRIIQIAGYDEYYNPSTERTGALFTENLGKMVRLAAREGVILAFETMETDFLNTVAKAMGFVNLINSPYLQVYPDIGNITNASVSGGHDLMEDLASGRGHIAAMHLKETVPGIFREVPYGTGHVDFEEALRSVRRDGVGLFVCEFWHTGGKDWREQLAFARNFMGKALQDSEGI